MIPRQPLDDAGQEPEIQMLQVTVPMIEDLHQASNTLIDSLIEASLMARRDGVPDVDFMMHIIKESVEGIEGGTGMQDIIMRAIGEGVLVASLVLRIRDGR